MNFLRTQTLTRIADSLKLFLNGSLWKTQSQLDLVAGQGIKFTQLETKDVSTLTVSTTGDNGSIGYWGSFWDMTDQTIASITSSSVVALGSSDPDNNGVSIVSGSRITFANPGVYNIAVSMQFVNTDSQAYLAYVWFRKNGVDISASASRFSVPSKHGSSDGSLIFYVNFMAKYAAGDYVQLAWTAGSTLVTLQHYHAVSGPPAIPDIPSVILTVNQV